MSHLNYILNDQNIPIPVDTETTEGLLSWAKEYEKHRTVQQDQIGPYWVSTIFLGMDMRWSEGPPLLFETMAFDHRKEDAYSEPAYFKRYSTYDLALEGHRRALTMAAAEHFEQDDE